MIKESRTPRRGNRQTAGKGFYHAPLWEHLAYGIGTALATAGPVVVGMDMTTWMEIFMGINAIALTVICVTGAWFSLRGTNSVSRRAH